MGRTGWPSWLGQPGWLGQPWQPYIDPRLEPQFSAALARLRSCAPDAYAIVEQHAFYFGIRTGNFSLTLPNGQIFIAADALHSGWSEDANQLELATIIAHESLHVQQNRNPPPYDRIADERAAYQLSLSILERCPTTDPAAIAYLIQLTRERIANPPLYSTPTPAP